MNLATAYVRHCTPNAYDSEAAYFSGLGDVEVATASPWYETLIKTGIPALTTAYAQQQLTKLNVARLNAGQSPLTAAEFTAYQPAAATVSVGPDSTAQKFMVAALVGGALYFGAKLAMGRRGR